MDAIIERDGILAPESFFSLSGERKSEICNGCGAKGSFVDFVPDGAFGADFTPACDVHDYEYWLGIDKRGADRRFLYNLLACCAVDCDNTSLYLLRCDIAIGYFKAVTALGGSSFGQH